MLAIPALLATAAVPVMAQPPEPAPKALPLKTESAAEALNGASPALPSIVTPARGSINPWPGVVGE